MIPAIAALFEVLAGGGAVLRGLSMVGRGAMMLGRGAGAAFSAGRAAMTAAVEAAESVAENTLNVARDFESAAKKAPKVDVKTTKDDAPKVRAALKFLKSREVLVGVPAEKAGRTTEDGEAPINNATLCYLHETGSPANNLPARPFLEPAILSLKDEINQLMMKAALRALDGKTDEAEKIFHIVGLKVIGQAVDNITQGIPPPLKDATVKARLRRHKGRKAERNYLKLRKQGVDPSAMPATARVTPLVDSGSLLRAISYSVSPVKN